MWLTSNIVNDPTDTFTMILIRSLNETLLIGIFPISPNLTFKKCLIIPGDGVDYISYFATVELKISFDIKLSDSM